MLGLRFWWNCFNYLVRYSTTFLHKILKYVNIFTVRAFQVEKAIYSLLSHYCFSYFLFPIFKILSAVLTKGSVQGFVHKFPFVKLPEDHIPVCPRCHEEINLSNPLIDNFVHASWILFNNGFLCSVHGFISFNKILLDISPNEPVGKAPFK